MNKALPPQEKCIKGENWKLSFVKCTKLNAAVTTDEKQTAVMRGYNEKSDIYSLGIVICELANGSDPFVGMSKTLMLTEKVRGCAPQLLDCTTVLSNENMENSGDCEVSNYVAHRRFSENLHELSNLCLQRDSYDRPNAGQLLTHPVFRNHKKCVPLPELLKPALPLSDRVAYDTANMN
ncbi:hypothetical protein NQ317_009240 [Molorchus minor]|uniref:Protein kinase domain-containing protein n=1 Tax=Molorchus minor TaxID=1323400 RepID=A0ABQ9IWV9_9CUCU|nr:hypothetical protein NQ317_009240 [Molorchus minor]